ncbi:MAG: CsbD family protein [Vicinamibacteraceae bacterium]
MNKDIFEGKWEQMKGEIKRRWGRLTDDDLTEAEGSTEKLIGRLQERYGYSKGEAEREVQDLFQSRP